MANAKVEILDSDENVVHSRDIIGSVGNGKEVHKVFNEDISVGRYVRVSMPGKCTNLHVAEVSVFGTQLSTLPYPPSSTSNLSIGKTAIQSSDYNNMGNPYAAQALDGDINTFTHTMCWQGFNQWWQVDLEAVHTISSVYIVNRQNCCGGRLHDFDIDFIAEDGVTIVDTIRSPGGLGSEKRIIVGECHRRWT